MQKTYHAKALDRLREGVAATLRWLGLVDLIVLVAAATLASFALDYVFELPWIVRVCALGGVLVGIVWVRRRHRARSSTNVPTADLLCTVETSHPELEGHLLNALQLRAEFKQTHEQRSELEVELLRRAVLESSTALRGVEVEKSLDLAPLRRRVALAAGLLAVIFLLGAFFPKTFFFWGERNVLLSTTPWPKETHFALERPEFVWHHSRKDPLPIEGWVIGRIPQRVELFVDAGGSTGTRAIVPGMKDVRTWTLASETTFGGPKPGDDVEGRKLSYHLPRVTEPFEFYFSGGDNRSRAVRVEVHDRPRVLSTLVTISYPKHTGQSTKTIKNPASEISGMIGSKVTLTLEADEEINSGWIRFAGDARIDVKELSKRTLRHAFTLTESGFSEIVFSGGEWDFESRPHRLAFAAYADAAPEATLAVDGESRIVTPTGRVSYTVTCEDDFGFHDIVLRIRKPQQIPDGEAAPNVEPVPQWGAGTGYDEITVDLAPWDVERKGDTSNVMISRELALKQFDLVPNTHFMIQAVVRDNDEPASFKTGESNVETFSVIAPEELLEKLDLLQTQAQTELEEIAFREKELAANLGAPEERTQQGAARDSPTQEEGEQSNESQAEESQAQEKQAQKNDAEEDQEAKRHQRPRPRRLRVGRAGVGSRRRPSESEQETKARDDQQGDRQARRRKLRELSGKQDRIAKSAQDVWKELRELRRVLQQNNLTTESEQRRFEEEITRPLEELSEEALPRNSRDIKSLRDSDSSQSEQQRAGQDAGEIARRFEELSKRLQNTKKFRELLDRLRIIIDKQGEVINETQRKLRQEKF